MEGTNGGHTCGFCNTNKGMVMDSWGECYCKEKTEYIDNLCRDICGDGFLMNSSNWACDDGNIKSGDGCSSDCLVEVGYKCSQGSSIKASTCVYLAGGDMMLELISIYRTDG